jgi:hypothetical protein
LSALVISYKRVTSSSGFIIKFCTKILCYLLRICRDMTIKIQLCNLKQFRLQIKIFNRIALLAADTGTGSLAADSRQ